VCLFYTDFSFTGIVSKYVNLTYIALFTDMKGHKVLHSKKQIITNTN